MPVPVKNPKKPLAPPKKKFKKEQLERVNRTKLKAFCRKKNLPYVRLDKAQAIENILLWQSGKNIKHPELVRTWEEAKNAVHKVSPQMRKFCLDYSTCTKKKTHGDWAKEFGVSTPTINLWLTWNETRALIEEYRYSIDQRITELFAQHQEIAIVELVSLITGKKVPSEVKRKAISDLLGYAGRVNVNATKVMISQKQAQGQKTEYSDLTEKQIDEQLKELDELEEG